MRRTLLVIMAAVVAAPSAARGDGLPVGNVNVGDDGVVVPGDPYRIVALATGSGALVARIQRDGGAVERTLRLGRQYTVPGVALDGSPDGRSYDGRTAVLIEQRPPGAFPRRRTRLLILRVRPLEVRRRITLRGDFSFDALSPDGRRMYLVHYVSPRDPSKYVVRSFDVRRGRLEPGAIVDSRDPDVDMRGYPITRATSRDGRWAYTLYDGLGDPFVHALDTVERRAFCIEMPFLAGEDEPYLLDLVLGPGRLSVRKSGKAVAWIDTRTYEATKPSRRVVQRRRPGGGGGGSSTDWWAIAIAGAVGVAALGGTLRRRRVRATP